MQSKSNEKKTNKNNCLEVCKVSGKQAEQNFNFMSPLHSKDVLSYKKTLITAVYNNEGLAALLTARR